MLGERVERALAGVAAIVPVVLDGIPHADAPTVDIVRRACAHADALVAVGSGTINDLCKYAAAQDGKPLRGLRDRAFDERLRVEERGHHHRRPQDVAAGRVAHGRLHGPWRAVSGARADDPRRSRRFAVPVHGAGRLAAFASPAGNALSTAPFALLADDEPALLDEPEALLRGDPDAMRALARTLCFPASA